MNCWQRWNKNERKSPVWILSLTVGVIFLIVGYQDGQLEEMYRKAVMICLECIGIG